jgi:metal-dependent amidase/aminoacylase/carboxypeptidase family protein
LMNLVERRLTEMASTIAQAFGAKAEIVYKPLSPSTTPQLPRLSSVAQDLVGKDRVSDNTIQIMGAEDFSFMLNARPGALMFIGNGDGASTHSPIMISTMKSFRSGAHIGLGWWKSG